MGLYESELTKQIHLRNRQKQEWDMMKKKMETEAADNLHKSNKEQELIQQEEREEERMELEETRVLKNLTSAMVNSSLHNEGDALHRVVEVLQNQNGNNT